MKKLKISIRLRKLLLELFLLKKKIERKLKVNYIGLQNLMHKM